MDNMNELYEYMFAYRIGLQDTHDLESDIIRELKYYLSDIGISQNLIDQTLFQFYQFYDIDISIDIIQQVSINDSQVLNNILNLLLNTNSMIPNLPTNLPEESEDSEQSKESEEQVEEQPVNVEGNGQNVNVEGDVQPVNVEGGGQTEPAQSDQDNTILNNNDVSDSVNEYSEPNNLLGMLLAATNQSQHPISNNLFGMLLAAANASHQYQYHQNHISNNIYEPNNLFDMLLATGIGNVGIVGNVANMSQFQDVTVTVDDKDLNELQTMKLESKLDINCSICMGCMDCDEVVTKLKCTHTFHSECITPYLKEYKNKCPICRDEISKGKYNI